MTFKYTIDPPPTNEEWAIIRDLLDMGKIFGYQVFMIIKLLRSPSTREAIEQEIKWDKELRYNIK